MVYDSLDNCDATVPQDKALNDFLLCGDFDDILAEATRLRDQGHGSIVSYSRKVFIPLTQLCRDVCHYCTFAKQPSRVRKPYLTRDEVVSIARAGENASCQEALFTLGDKPEMRYRQAERALAQMGFSSTVEYLYEACRTVLEQTALIPHVNAGLMGREDLSRLREVSASQGLMLESVSRRLMEQGGPHYGCPDKDPQLRLAMIDDAGSLRIPFTSGLLIGIGETRSERLAALYSLKRSHDQYGHLQEIIIQNFRAKEGTRMEQASEPSFDDLRWTIAAARLIFGPAMNIQAPPNLSYTAFSKLIGAGLNDWGGVSPVTPDHVNPEAAWPHIRILENQTADMGKVLTPRLPSYPSYVRAAKAWHAPQISTQLLRASDAEGYARGDDWVVGGSSTPPVLRTPPLKSKTAISVGESKIVRKAMNGARLNEGEIAALFSARGAGHEYVLEAADALRLEATGAKVGYVVNRNINYTNLCMYHCRFCAFSKARGTDAMRERAYDIPTAEIERRVREAVLRGATEVCLQGGIHPDYTGETYLEIVSAVKRAAPQIHVHAFSPLEVTHGAESLGISIREFLSELKLRGLGSLPGTAAEVLDDEVRDVLCPDKLSTQGWLDVIKTSHQLGLKTTSTLMFGHIDQSVHWARHLLALRAVQADTGGITEFVPLPFVPFEAPIYASGNARMGPTYREALLMHAVSRIALYPVIPNIQVSWVKMGPEGAKAALRAGANDMGGTLMNESISRSAGARHGQEMSPEYMDRLIAGAGRVPHQRTTLYGTPPGEQVEKSYNASSLSEVDAPAAGKYAAIAGRRAQRHAAEQGKE